MSIKADVSAAAVRLPVPPLPDVMLEPLVRAALLEDLGERRARLTITEGRYHQVRRMFAAVGNHVEALHRTRVGGLELGGLAPGQWRQLDAGDLSRLFGETA